MITRLNRYVAGNYRQHINWTDPISAGIGGVFSVFSNLFGANQQRKENARNRQFAHDEAVLAHERNLELTDKLNEWNSFGNQRKLLQEAGYNPNALLGQGGAIARGSSVTGSSQASNPSQGSVGHPLLDPAMITALSQATLNNAQAEKTDSEKHLIDLQTTQQDIQNQIGQIKLGLEKKFAEVEKQLQLQKIDWDIAVASATEASLKVDKQLKFNELTSLRPLQAMKLVADTIETNTSATLNQALAAKTDQERQQAVAMHFATLGLVAANTAKSYADANKANTDANNWTAGSGILWRNANNDYWLGHHDVNTSTLENAIYQQILRDYQADIKNTYGQKLYNQFYESKYGAFYWRELKDNPFWTRNWYPRPTGGEAGIMSIGKKGAEAAVGAAIRKAVFKL